MQAHTDETLDETTRTELLTLYWAECSAVRAFADELCLSLDIAGAILLGEAPPSTHIRGRIALLLAREASVGCLDGA